MIGTRGGRHQDLPVHRGLSQRRAPHTGAVLTLNSTFPRYSCPDSSSFHSTHLTCSSPLLFPNPFSLTQLLIPFDCCCTQLKVDMEKEALLLPINGRSVPFHISTIKNISMPEQDRATWMRINFFIPGVALGKDVAKNIQQLVSVEEISKMLQFVSFILRRVFFHSILPCSLNLLHTVQLILFPSIFTFPSLPLLFFPSPHFSPFVSTPRC